VDAVDTWCATYPGSPVVLAVLGSNDPAAIRAVARRYEPEPAEIFFFAVSVGAVFGLRLRDGSRRALKVNVLFDDPAYFAEVQELQRALRRAGFPAPLPLRREGTTVVEEWLDRGEFRDAHEPAVRAAMARELVRFVELASESGHRPRRRFLRPQGALWPRPHNALFDFEGTAAGAEWIDEIARAARAVPEAGDEVVGHFDWSAKHLRFDDGLCATAVYDWDSVSTDTEPAVVGTAAASFTYTEELAVPVALWPSLAEARAFVDDYEHERGRLFSGPERAAAGAACVYLRAYAARCVHAVGGDADASGLDSFAAALL
jgi:Phosphotransferase enzyme family